LNITKKGSATRNQFHKAHNAYKETFDQYTVYSNRVSNAEGIRFVTYKKLWKCWTGL